MYQKIIIVGNLGRDPEMRYMPDGTAVTSFSVATNRSWTDSRTNEKVDETTWFRISVWGRRAEVANQYLQRGSKILVEGRLTPDRSTGGPRLWTRQDGTVSASFEVRATDFSFVGSRQDADQYQGQSDSNDFSGGAVEEDDIPF